MKTTIGILMMAVVVGFGVVYFGCQSEPQNVVVEEGGGAANDFSEFVSVPEAIRNGEWVDVYAWVQGLPRESLYVYDLVPHPTADFSRDAPRDMENRDEFVEQLWKMALHMRGFTRVEDPSANLAAIAVPSIAPGHDESETTTRILQLSCNDASGPDYGFSFPASRDGLDDPCADEAVTVYPWRTNGSSIGSFIAWNGTADSGNCAIRTTSYVVVPKMTTPSMILCRVSPRWSMKIQWTDGNHYSVVRHKDTTAYQGNNIITYQHSAALGGDIYTDRCIFSSFHPDVSPQIEVYNEALVQGAVSQAILRSSTSNGTYSWLSHDGIGYGSQGQPASFLDPNDGVNSRSEYNWDTNILTGAAMADWHNCYLKVNATPWFRFNRFGSEGGVTSTCADSTFSLFMQMGAGDVSWPATCNSNPNGYFFNRKYLGGTNPPTFNCTGGFQPLCNNGYYFSMMSWGSSTVRPWRDAGKLYFSVYRRTKWQYSPNTCNDWQDNVYQPYYVTDGELAAGTHIVYYRKVAGCACIDPPQ